MTSESTDIPNIATYALDAYGKDAAGFLYKELFYSEAYLTKIGQTLRILYVGKRAQKASLTPLLAEIIRKRYKENLGIDAVEITTIGHAESEGFFKEMTDGSDYSLIEARDKTIHGDTQKQPLKITLVPSHRENIKNFSFALPFDKQGINIGNYRFEEKYDIIFCSWEFHFDLNWRLAHTHVLTYLKGGGSLIFTETTGDSSLFDGNFKEGKTDTNGELYDFMRSFDDERNKHAADDEKNAHDFFWNPEISTSDYSQMRRQAEFYFKTVSIDKKAKHYKGQLKRSKLIEYFNDQAFSYLKIGVTRHIIDAFIKKAADLPKVIPIKKRLQYYVATGFMPEELDKIASRHWRYDDLIKHLQELNDHKPDMLSRKALDTLVSHDIFFPKHTISCSFFYWLSNDTDHWDYPVHIVNNHILNTELPDKGRNQLDIYKQFLELMTLESLNDKGVFRYLIRDIKNKMRISFQFFKETDAVKELEKKDYKTPLDCLAYKVEYDKKRKPISLKLAFSKQLFDAALMGDFVQLMAEKTNEVVADILKNNKLENISDEILRGPETEETYNNIPEIPVKALKIREEIPKVRGAIKRFSIAEEMQKAYESFEQNNMELFKKAFNDLVEPFKSPNDEQKEALKIINDISKIINEDVNNSLEQSAAEAQLLLEILLSIALFTWDYEDRELSFYPSAAVENEKQYSEGLGGIVVSEKLFSINDKSNTLGKNQVNLLIARNNALEEASNQIFYKIGISDHVNHRYRTFAQQSAVATIISRNGSHGIGSHAIPSLVNDHRDLWQKGDKEALLAALRDDDIFYKYLQDRFEFITQLGNPTLPKWTLTTWFGKDLLKRFLMQRHLLNNLASSERLRAFEFLQQSNWNHQEALETNVGAVRECLYGEVIKEGDKWFVKKIGSTNLTHKREIVWKEPKDAQTADKIRVSGQLSVKEGVPYLKDAELIVGRILLKVRLRQFLSYDADGQSIKINQQGEKVKLTCLALKTNARGELFEKNAEGQWVKRTEKEDFQDKSELISHSIHVIRCTDIGELQEKIANKKGEIERKCTEIEKKREKLAENRVGEFDIEKTKKEIEALSKTQEVYFYGIICDKNKLEIRLGNREEDVITLELKTDFADKQKLNTGRRIIFTGDFEGNAADKKSYVFKNVVIEELLFSKHIIHPREDEKRFEKDIPVSIVGGIVGYQAFYSILENIIRNAAKHNWQLFDDTVKKRSNLVVSIELEDQLDEDNYICKVWTNTTDVRYKKGMKGVKVLENDKIGVFDKEHSLVEQLRKKLESSIIDPQGKPKQEDIGVSEIKICAAFLANKDWTLDPSVLTGKKAVLKHKTERTPTDTDGYIRTFVAWEAEGAALIPRLGYRFRLLKAKEVLFFVPNEADNAPEDATLTTHLKNWAEENKASKVVTYAGKLPNLDYECCVLIAPKNEEEVARYASKDKENTSLLADIFDYTNREYRQATKKQQNELIKKTIKYPHRLLVVCTDAKSKIAVLKEKNNKIGHYLRQRMVFIERADFDAVFTHYADKKDGESDMQLWLYNQWVCFTEGKNERFKLDISIDANETHSASETARMNIPTLPFSLRGEAKNDDKTPDTEGVTLQQKLVAFNDLRLKLRGNSPESDKNNAETTDKSKIIKFARHAPYDEQMHFLESLSGGKVSFSTFANVLDIDKKEADKFFMQLMEAAQNFVLVLDERIMEYALGHPERYAHFENANILIPTEFTVNNKNLHREEKFNTTGLKEKTMTYSVENEDKLTVVFYQQIEKAAQITKASGRITTVIIHQTLLEKIIDKGANTDESEKKKAEIDAFIRWLKIDLGIPGVIITSGRGKNNNTSDLAKFIPFSDISSLLMQYFPEKWMLNRIITESLH